MQKDHFLDYFMFENTTYTITEIQGLEIYNVKAGTTGVSKRMYNDKGSTFISSNDQNNVFLEKFIKQNNIEKALNEISIEPLSIDLSKEFSQKVQNIVNYLGDIISYNLLVRIDIRNNIIVTNTNMVPIIKKFKITTAEITIHIRKDGNPILIKRSISLDDSLDYEEQLNNFVQSLIDSYFLFINKPIISIPEHEYDLILPAGRGGIFIHEAIGHALESDHFFASNGILHEKMYKKIAGDNFTVSDKCSPSDIVYIGYADDGSPTHEVTLINDGIIEGVLSDRLTSKKWKIPNTGNGRACSFEQPVIPRMRNTYLHNGDYNPNDIIKETKCGVYALDIGGGEVDLITGDFVFNIYSGYYIKNGSAVGLTQPILFKGNIHKSIKEIDMIGNDLAFQYALCGKKGQNIPVSYGQPTIRIRGQVLKG